MLLHIGFSGLQAPVYVVICVLAFSFFTHIISHKLFSISVSLSFLSRIREYTGHTHSVESVVGCH